MEQILCKSIAWSPLVQVSVLCIGTLVSFLVAYFKHDVSIYLPFISENGAIIPEMGIFSSTVILGSFIGVLTVCYRYLVVLYMLSDGGDANAKFKKLNLLAWLCGLGSMAGLAGVAAFPMSTILVVHLIVAGIHFSLAMAYLFINTYLCVKMRSTNHEQSFVKIRIALCVSLCIFLFLLVVCMPFAYFKWIKLHPKILHALKTPSDEGFGLLFCSAFFEWSLYVSFLTYIVTFLSEFRRFQLVLFVEPVTKNAPESSSDRIVES